MALMERKIMRVCPGRQDEALDWDTRWDGIEARIGGFPEKRRYWAVAGLLPQDTFVWEREWACFSEMQDAYTRLREDVDAQTLAAGADGMFVGDAITEYYMAL